MMVCVVSEEAVEAIHPMSAEALVSGMVMVVNAPTNRLNVKTRHAMPLDTIAMTGNCGIRDALGLG